uniref:Multidrug efflux RND transporter permease subunit n=1 Tax=uncultured Elusimicrobia bacterium TaxID=699876 RepID=A0A650ELB9_9BACT|nr:multidrug efflux RND transporter permease subunit [uncultured Elusimicrobia bacterium]
MFSKFFIKRPRFAIVISLLLCLAGLIAVKSLPIALYPEITPPEVVVRATYPGASAEVIAKTVGIPLEDKVNGVEDMLYMSSNSSDGSYDLTVTFKTGVDPDIAQVKVQNRVSQATSQLPGDVTRQGLTIYRRSSNILGFISFTSPNGTLTDLELSDYLNNNVAKNISRISGVGEAMVFGASKSMRVWLDADKMAALNISQADVTNAISSQNYQPSLGKIGARPTTGNVLTVYALQTDGRLNKAADFENIIVRTDEQGGQVRLKEIAKVEEGQESYSHAAQFDGKTSIPMMVNLSSGANAVETMKLLKAELKRLEQFFPEDMAYDFSVDTTDFIYASIYEVVETLIITFLLVVLVCYVFLQDWRATLVPSATIPVSLLGTFAVMLALGYSINLFTLFALVLAIGLVVDDAICVVERVIYLMNREHKGPVEATTQAMEELSGALIATTLVLLAIFVPICFMGGITGEIYKQFAVTISVAVCFSTLNALSLSPAICATMLRPVEETKFFALRWFNFAVQRGARSYKSVVKKIARKMLIIGLLFAGFLLLDGVFVKFSQTSFIPTEDQGVALVDIQLPEGAAFARTKAVLEKITPMVRETPGVKHMTAVIGHSMVAGSGENVAMAFLSLDPWDKRKAAPLQQTAIVNKLTRELSSIPEATIRVFEMPSIPGLGTTGGLDLRLQALNDFDYQQLAAAADGSAFKMMMDPSMMIAYSTFKADTPNIYLDVDRTKAEAMNVPVSSVYSVLEKYLGSSYIGDVNFGTQVNKVIIQSDAKYRVTPDDINKMYVPNTKGELVPLRALVDLRYVLSPRQISRYNQYPAASLNASPAAGSSSGEAMAATEKIMQTLPAGYAYEWSGMSYQEKQNEGQLGLLILLAVVFAYLFLVAQYESWTIPMPVLMSVVAAVGGGLFGLWITNLPLSIYAQLGLVLLVGLAAKNAILIVEFSKDEHAKGTTAYMAALDGLTQRFRPVLMTAFTFILGMLPMVVATGAGAASRRALGVPVFYGMLLGTLLGLILIPLFYILVQTYVDKWDARRKKEHAAQEQPAKE